MLALALLAAPTVAGTWGVSLDKGRGKASITPAGDVDSYAVRVAAGQRISVSVTRSAGSPLLPVLVVRDPNGAPVQVPLESRSKGLKVRPFNAAMSGLYQIDVSGADATTGPYTVRARVRGSANVRLKETSIAPRETLRVPFAASGGAKVKFTAKGGTVLPGFVGVEDPLGRLIAVSPEAVRVRGRKLASSWISLPDDLPFGPFTLILESTGSPVTGLSVSLKTKGPRLVPTRGRLPDAEPRLTAAEPAEVGVGTVLTVLGSGFVRENTEPPRVFVGGLPLADVSFDGPTRLRGTVPEGLSGRLDVALTNGDGHTALLRDAVEVVPPPRPVAMTATRGSARGGTSFDVTGQDFRPGAAVTISGVAFPEETTFVDATRLRFVTPPFAQGEQRIGVRDPTGLDGTLAAPFTFVPPPRLDSVRPPLVARLADEEVTLTGGDFSVTTTAHVDDTALDVVVSDPTNLLVTLPLLARGPHDLRVAGEFGEGNTLTGAVRAFDFEMDDTLPDSTSLTPSDLALADFDGDGDQDVFVAAPGGANRASVSHVRVFRNDGDGFTDVTASVMPAVTNDDWRADCLALGDVAGSGGTPAPDGWPDLVLGTTDASVLPTDRSRIRILANQGLPDGSRRFSDRTSSLMAATVSRDDWTAADLWIGDLDGDGGVPDIVAVHDGNPSEVSPLPPYYVYHESGTRVFSYAASDSRFAWQSRRMPHVLGSRQPVQGLPTCSGNECADDFMPFRGVSLGVADIDGDGRLDLAVTAPGSVVVNGVGVASTQLGRNVVPSIGALPRFDDVSNLLPTLVGQLKGHIVLFGNVIGDDGPDVVVVQRSAASGARAIEIIENRGLGGAWSQRTADLVPSADGEERFQAHAAELVDVDGDADLDIVLLTDAGPDGGRALRILRNRGERGFSLELVPLLPSVTNDDALEGESLAAGPLDEDGAFGIVIGRGSPAQADAIRLVRRKSDAE